VGDQEDHASRGAEERIDLSGLGRLSDRPPPPKGENAIRVARALSVLLLAVAAAGLPWYFVTRGGDPESAGGSPTTTPATTTSSPSPTTTRLAFEVFNVQECANFRSEPSTRSTRLDCLLKGVRLTSDGRTQDAEGRLWRHVYYEVAKTWGWMADEYLKPAG
jgi:hypothetical protein